VNLANCLQEARPLALVVDAAGGAAPSQREDTSRLPTDKVVSCSLADTKQWLDNESASADAASMPALAQRLREAGAGSVCIVGIAGPDGRPLDWLDSEQARGWLAPAGGTFGNGELFAGRLAAAMDKGFVAADAAVLARMATTRRPPASTMEFVHDPALLPQLSWGEAARFGNGPPAAAKSRRLDLYAIVDSADRLQQVLAAGVKTVQLRIKTPAAPDAQWQATLRREVQRSVAACEKARAELFINDHWQLAAELGARGVHLGQEDLVALGDAGRSAVQATGMALGVSSHSLWELCRARTLRPRYIACGPVWPTITKAMPWIAQGPDNLIWWCRMAQAPVVAIGGVLTAKQVYVAARCGADGVCIVRGLGEQPQQVVPALQCALEAGRKEQALTPMQPTWPHPSLSAMVDAPVDAD
jgi:hydroxymethylpyrimidine kinase / phosphomethylpyrimidine kinase / thiamine-phosphate diphosphorylase